MSAARHGVTLVETLVAVVVLSTAALALLRLCSAYGSGFSRARAEESELRDADRLMTAMALLTRADLDRRLGVRDAGAFALEVSRPRAGIYRLAVRSAGRDRALLVTLVHRPAGAWP